MIMKSKWRKVDDVTIGFAKKIVPGATSRHVHTHTETMSDACPCLAI